MPYRSIFRDGLFTSQTVLITGGGSGIGRCTAHELATLGATVIIVGRRADKLEQTADEIKQEGGQVDHRVLDIREEQMVQEVVASIVKEHGPLSGLVNNAGGQFFAPLESISGRGFETVVRTNLVGGFLVSREVYRQCMQQHGGVIVNIVADMHNGMPGMAHSGAARAGMVNFTKTAAVEWAPSGVRVNAVAPGWITSSGMDTYEGPARAIIPRLKESVPLRRLGTEAEVSAAICFLLSEAAAFITGATLRVDGGAPLFSAPWPIPDHDRSSPFEGFHLAVMPEVLK